MKLTLMLVLFGFGLLSACTQYDSYSQTTGFAAPVEHSVADPLLFCGLSVAVSDPLYIEADKQLVIPVLKRQLFRYLNADARLQIADEHCDSKVLTVDFLELTDHRRDGAVHHSAEARVTVAYNDKRFSFVAEEVSQSIKSECFYCDGVSYSNSARNRGRLIEKLIPEVDRRVRGGVQ